MADATVDWVDVLIVDDSADTCRVLRRLFRVEGYRAETKGDGSAALAYLAGNRPKVVLLDVMMPGMNGLEVLRHLRGDPDWSRTADVPVVLYTAACDPDVTREGLRLGANAVLPKAGGWDALYPQLKNYLSLPNEAGGSDGIFQTRPPR